MRDQYGEINMLSTERIRDVAGQKAIDIEERYPGYRIDLVTRLVEILRKQGEGLNPRYRRTDVLAIVEAFAKQTAEGTEGRD